MRDAARKRYVLLASDIPPLDKDNARWPAESPAARNARDNQRNENIVRNLPHLSRACCSARGRGGRRGILTFCEGSISGIHAHGGIQSLPRGPKGLFARTHTAPPSPSPLSPRSWCEDTRGRDIAARKSVYATTPYKCIGSKCRTTNSTDLPARDGMRRGGGEGKRKLARFPHKRPGASARSCGNFSSPPSLPPPSLKPEEADEAEEPGETEKRETDIYVYVHTHARTHTHRGRREGGGEDEMVI